MKSVSMSGSLRENVGKKDAKMNRKNKMVPCVLYGGKEQLHFVMDEKAFQAIIFTPEVYLADITIGDKTYKTCIKEVQYHPVTDNILHADFVEVSPNKPFIISIPLKLEGTPEGVLKGGRIVKKFRKIRVKANLENMPDDIVLNIEKLDIGQSVKIADIVLPNVTIMENPAVVAVEVATTRAAETSTEGTPSAAK